MIVFTTKFDGTTIYTDNLDGALSQIDADDLIVGDEIVVSVITMLRKDYLRLPEFEGF